MDVDGVYISISHTLQTRGIYFLRTTFITALAVLLTRYLGLPHSFNAAIFLCVTAYLVFSIHHFLIHSPAEEDDTAPPDIDTTPTLSRGAKPTMQTSPTFERVQAAGKAKPTHAVVWPKSQVWKRDAMAGRRDGVEGRERGEEMGW